MRYTVVVSWASIAMATTVSSAAAAAFGRASNRAPTASALRLAGHGGTWERPTGPIGGDCGRKGSAVRMRARPLSSVGRIDSVSPPVPPPNMSLSRTEIRRMRVADLREELSRRDMSGTGLRGVLVERLLGAQGGDSDPTADSDQLRDPAPSIPASASDDLKRLGKGQDEEGPTPRPSTSVSLPKGYSIAPSRVPVSTIDRLSAGQTYILQVDGGARGNPGLAGAGMALFDAETGLEVWHGYHFLGFATNNEAEYSGLVTGLRAAHGLGVTNVIVEADSLLVVRQLQGAYKVKKQNLRPLFEQARSLLEGFDSFELRHIPREANGRADGLANMAMDTKVSKGINFLKGYDGPLGTAENRRPVKTISTGERNRPLTSRQNERKSDNTFPRTKEGGRPISTAATQKNRAPYSSRGAVRSASSFSGHYFQQVRCNLVFLHVFICSFILL